MCWDKAEHPILTLRTEPARCSHVAPSQYTEIPACMQLAEQGCHPISPWHLYSLAMASERCCLARPPQAMVPGSTSSPPRSTLSKHSNSPATLPVTSNMWQQGGRTRDHSLCPICRWPSPGAETQGHLLACLSADAVQLPLPAPHLPDSL